MRPVEPASAPSSLLLRAARECGIVLGQLLGVILLLFLILESGAIADPAARALGERPSMQRLGEMRVEMGYFRSFDARSAELELRGGANTVALRGENGKLLLETVQGSPVATFDVTSKSLAELATELMACEALAPTRLHLRLADEQDARPAKGWLAALRGTRLLVDTRRPALVPWADARAPWQRFLTQTGELLRLDFGRSLDGAPVAQELRRRGLRSLAVSLPGLILSSVLALAFALWAVRRVGQRFERALGWLSGLVLAVSSVSWILLWRSLFAGELQWFPVAAWDPPSLWSLTLPILLWVWIATWPDFHVYRTLLLASSRAPHLTAARARGLAARTIRRQHLLRHAGATLIAHFVLALPFLVLGSLVLEQTFVIPGLGEYVVRAARAGDAAVLRAVTLCVAMGYILSQRLGDWAAGRLDPRWRLDHD